MPTDFASRMVLIPGGAGVLGTAVAKLAAWPKVGQVAAAIVLLASPANMLTSGALAPVYGRA